MLHPSSFLKRGVKCGLKVWVAVGQFKAVVEKGDRLVQLSSVVGISSLTALFALCGDDL